MGKREEIRNMSIHICTSRSVDTQLYGLIDMLRLLASGTKNEYSVNEAIKAYNERARWANSSGSNHYMVFDVFEDENC